MRTNLALLFVAASCLVFAGCGASSDPGPEQDTHDHADAATADEPTSRTVTGQLSGFDCAVVGELCPTTHRGADYTTGVFTDDKSFYFVVNIPQSFLTQYFRKTVKVTGTVYPPYDRAVEPEVIRLVEEDDSRTVYEEGYFIDADGGRATFQEGEYRDGRWIAP